MSYNEGNISEQWQGQNDNYDLYMQKSKNLGREPFHVGTVNPQAQPKITVSLRSDSVRG